MALIELETETLYAHSLWRTSLSVVFPGCGYHVRTGLDGSVSSFMVFASSFEDDDGELVEFVPDDMVVKKPELLLTVAR